LLVLGILKTEKSRVRDRFISYSKYSRRGTLFIQEKVCCFFTICKSRSGFGKIFCTVFETLCASSLAMWAYQIAEHLHLTFAEKNLMTIIQNISES
jgi:hypothetical protein